MEITLNLDWFMCLWPHILWAILLWYPFAAIVIRHIKNWEPHELYEAFMLWVLSPIMLLSMLLVVCYKNFARFVFLRKSK